MRVVARRSARIEPFENITCEVEVADTDFVGLEQLSAEQRMNYLAFKANDGILRHLLLHNCIGFEEVKAERKTAFTLYGIGPIHEVLGVTDGCGSE